MKTLPRVLPVILAFALATPSLAQETSTEAEETPDPLELNMGDEASGEIKVGDVYLDSLHGDWELRCVKAPEGRLDNCQMYQLLSVEGQEENAVAEINLFPLPKSDGQAVAGATIVTPLETLLTSQLGLSVDGGDVRRYPFSWCSTIGCFSRVGFTQGEIDQFKRGASARIIIVPVVAPDQTVNLNVSLTGFTAAYDAAIAKLPSE